MKKRIAYSLLLAVLLVTLGFGMFPAAASLPAASPAQDEPAYVPNQLIVDFAPSQSLGSFTFPGARVGSIAWRQGVEN